MTEPRIVTPEEAQREVRLMTDPHPTEIVHLAYARTVATEPGRTRAAVVKALRRQTKRLRALYGSDDLAARTLDEQADAIENGADW